MTGLKAARILRCVHCPWFRNGIPPVFDSPGCRAGGCYTSDGPLIDVPGYGSAPSHAMGDPILILGDMYYEGPETNCPVGWWVGLTPVDFDAGAAQTRMGVYAGYRTDLFGKPLHLRLLRGAIQKAGLKAVRVLILDAIAAQEYFLWFPVDIMRDLGTEGVVALTAYRALLRDGAARVVAATWGGNDPAWYALRDYVESQAQLSEQDGVRAQGEADVVAGQLGITEPTGV